VFYLHSRQCASFASALFLSRDSVWYLPRAQGALSQIVGGNTPGEASASSLGPHHHRSRPASLAIISGFSKWNDDLIARAARVGGSKGLDT
jgi:hypothetical protein